VQPISKSVAFPATAGLQIPLTVRVPEACRITGIGRSKLYELIRDGKIRTIKVGAMTLVPVSSLAEFLGLDMR
jgi:excisionase family DNA binding protein